MLTTENASLIQPSRSPHFPRLLVLRGILVVISELRVDGLEAQILFERFEITIPMQKGMAFDQTEASNQAIDRLSDRTPARP
jgi:hypothetical protein